jgi:hypothetical protein
VCFYSLNCMAFELSHLMVLNSLNSMTIPNYCYSIYLCTSGLVSYSKYGIRAILYFIGMCRTVKCICYTLFVLFNIEIGTFRTQSWELTKFRALMLGMLVNFGMTTQWTGDPFYLVLFFMIISYICIQL